MERISRTEIKTFISKLVQARKLRGLPDLHHHDLELYAQTLINGASTFQLLASMMCSDRLDLVDPSDDGSNTAVDTLAKQFKQFCTTYLGLPLLVQYDPRGAVFKLVVPPGLGNSFGDSSDLCVPCIDAYTSIH